MDSNNIYSAPVLGTAFVKDPNNMIDFGTAMINWKATHRKLKGYKKSHREKITKLYNKLIFKKYGKWYKSNHRKSKIQLR